MPKAWKPRRCFGDGGHCALGHVRRGNSELYGHIELTESAPEKDEDFIFLWVCSFFDKKKSKDQRFLFSSCFILL